MKYTSHRSTGHLLWDSEFTFRNSVEMAPFRDLTGEFAEAAETSIGGKPIETGVALPIEYGCISLNGRTPVVERKVKNDAVSVKIEANLKAGMNTLQTWFKDKEGNDICGSYYVRVFKY